MKSILKQKSDIRRRRTLKRQKKEQEERDKKVKEEQKKIRNKIFGTKIGSLISKKKIENTLRKLKEQNNLENAISKIQKAYKRSLLKKTISSRIKSKKISPKTLDRMKKDSKERLIYLYNRSKAQKDAVSEAIRRSKNRRKISEEERQKKRRNRLSVINEAVAEANRRSTIRRKLSEEERQINNAISQLKQLTINSPRHGYKRKLSSSRSGSLEKMDIDSPNYLKQPSRKRSRRI